MKKKLKKIVPIIKNKYLLTALFLVVWLLFFDKNDVLSQIELKEKIKELETERDFYVAEIAKNRKEMEQLRSNPAALEKLAREKYLMKKSNEDVYVLVGE